MLNFVAVLLLAATYAHHGPAVLAPSERNW